MQQRIRVSIISSLELLGSTIQTISGLTINNNV